MVGAQEIQNGTQAIILQDTSTVYSRALGKPDLTREAVCAVPMQTFIEETFPVRHSFPWAHTHRVRSWL